jgi:hypothetical protein
MARPRKGAKKDAGQPGVITAKSTRKKYTSAVRSGLLQSMMASMSLSPPPPPPPEIEKSLQPAARQVFDTPELLAMILALLPLNTDRNALLVCRSFSQCTHPRAERHLYGIKEALGIKHPPAVRSITDLDGYQQRDIKAQPRTSYAERPLRLDWLFNIGFEDTRPPNMLRQPSETYLEIAPFVVGSIKGSLEDGCVRVYLRLDCRDVEKDVAMKGVGKLRDGEYEQYSNRAPNGVRYSFLDIKVLKEPFNLRVAVRVDFRKAMQASSSHAQGPCPIPGCQVGLYGRQVRFSYTPCGYSRHVINSLLSQTTQRDFISEEATIEEFLAFLDIVEHDVYPIVREITQITKSEGKRPHGEAYYLGTYTSLSH